MAPGGKPGSGSGTNQDPGRAELDDAPPLLTWRAIYLIVLAALAVEVLLGAALTLAAA
jgi:hypothetical protein